MALSQTYKSNMNLLCTFRKITI